MTVKSIVGDGVEFVKARSFLISWISLVIYLFYDTFVYYQNGRQFYYLRKILGLGLCVSRGTATVLNLCGALILLPQCKKLNQILYRILSKVWPRLFFIWLEKAKSFHMTVATTLVTFGVLHSTSHLVNLWNFSRGFDEERRDINLAKYENENPILLLLSTAGITGSLMLITTLCMGITSLRVVRRRVYNAFWYAHQLYLPFMVLFLIHPLSGVLKQEVINNESAKNPSHYDSWTNYNSTINTPRFTSIPSKTWLWMSAPLACFFLDLLWRICSRNRAVVDIIEAKHMAGRTISLNISCANYPFVCRAGQYVVLQCPQASLIEWHPFTIVKVPTSYQRNFVVWIRVKGDWTETLEKLLKENGPQKISLLVDGPFSSPMEAVSRSDVAICVAAGVGITPFVSILHHMLLYPRSHLPGRIHLIWIVRHEQELTWLADLAHKTIRELRESNRPDRLHLQLYVTNTQSEHTVVVENGFLKHVVDKDEERATLLTPHLKRPYRGDVGSYSVAKDYPLLGCRVKQGRPHWDRVFGYWVHLYPEDHLHLYCCGPKKIVQVLRNKCKETSRKAKTKFTFVHEGFSANARLTSPAFQIVLLHALNPEAVSALTSFPNFTNEAKTEKQSNSLQCLQCPLCLDDMHKKTNLVATKCGHVFCSQCLRKAIRLNPTCPICRKKITGKYGYHPLYLI